MWLTVVKRMSMLFFAYKILWGIGGAPKRNDERPNLIVVTEYAYPCLIESMQHRGGSNLLVAVRYSKFLNIRLDDRGLKVYKSCGMTINVLISFSLNMSSRNGDVAR